MPLYIFSTSIWRYEPTVSCSLRGVLMIDRDGRACVFLIRWQWHKAFPHGREQDRQGGVWDLQEGDATEIFFNQRFYSGAIKITDSDHRHKIRSVPIMIEAPQFSRIEIFNNFFFSDRHTLRIA